MNKGQGIISQYFPTDYPYDIKVTSKEPLTVEIFFENKSVYKFMNEIPLKTAKDKNEVLAFMIRSAIDTVDKGWVDRIVRKAGLANQNQEN